MKNDYISKWEEMKRNSHKYYTDTTSSFSEYIKNLDEKFVIAITKCQYVFLADFKKTHDEMIINIIKSVRPDIKTDCWGNAYNPEEDFRIHNLFILGYPNYAFVSLPENELLSLEQYENLEEIGI